MNVYDTELVKSILTDAKYQFTNSELDADIIMLNTCAIREHAHQKVYGRIHEIHHKRKKLGAGNRGQENIKIGILGCMATNLRTDLLENKKLKIDFIAGPDSYKKLPKLIEESYRTGEKQFDLTLSEFETYSDVFPSQRNDVNPSTHPAGSLRVNAWLSVQRGCNNFCTFCVVPYTRGRERSRSIPNIVEEVARLTADGFRQVTLLGQNVNSYHCDGRDFADLLEAISLVNGLKRIRFTSPHPKDFPDKLLDVVAHNPKVCKQVHLPLQSGNNRILDLMNRTYTQEEFLALVDKTRLKIPGVALSTDIIVGFCSETDAEFEDTVKVMEHVQFDSAFMFKYSQRKGTTAERKHKDDVPEAIKTERIVRLNEIQREIMLKRNRALIGQTVEVLIEQAETARSQTDMKGRSDGNHIVIFPQGDYGPGDTINVTITDANALSLKGIPAS